MFPYQLVTPKPVPVITADDLKRVAKAKATNHEARMDRQRSNAGLYMLLGTLGVKYAQLGIGWSGAVYGVCLYGFAHHLFQSRMAYLSRRRWQRVVDTPSEEDLRANFNCAVMDDE